LCFCILVSLCPCLLGSLSLCSCDLIKHEGAVSREERAESKLFAVRKAGGATHSMCYAPPR
jgi:hypothetical protein